MDFLETISHAETRGHGNPNEVRGRLQDQLNLFIAKGQYLEWAHSAMRRSYGELQTAVKASWSVPYQDRLICASELSTQYRSKFHVMVARLKLASHHIEAALQSWNLRSAEELLTFAKLDLDKADQLIEQLTTAIAVHQEAIQEVLALRDQLLCLEGAMQGLMVRYNSLQERYYNLDPAFVSNTEVVSDHAHSICESGFGGFTFPQANTLFGLQMEGLQHVVVRSRQAVRDADIEELSRALELGKQSITHVQVYLTELDRALVEFETAAFLVRHNGCGVDIKQPIWASEICESPIKTMFDPKKVFQSVIGHAPKGKAKVLQPGRDIALRTKDKHRPAESGLENRLQLGQTQPKPLVKVVNHAACQHQGPGMAPGKKLILKVDGVIQGTWNLADMPKRFSADDLLEKVPAYEDFQYDGANVLSYKDFDYIGPEENDEQKVTPTLQHPRPRSLSPKSAVEKWMKELPDDVVLVEAP